MGLYDRAGIVKRLRLPENKRILVISDIHGNLEYLKGVLAKANFSADDELIIDGDFLEKGSDSLGTLRYIMELSKGGNVHTVCGNCDDWFVIFKASPEADEHLLQYILRKKCGILWDMCDACGIDPFDIECFGDCKKKLFMSFQDEWRFLSSLPHAIETENFIFAHAAVNPKKRLSEHTIDDFVRCDYFMKKGYRFDKWVVVGHTPVVLYNKGRVCANPIVDRDAKIVSIDGGCVLKDDGQLNCLIIPHKFSDHFFWESYDKFKEYKALDAQTGSTQSCYVPWDDSLVQVLERGEEFSHCRHVSSGYELDILTKYLYSDTEFTNCNDCTDYVLPVRKGDMLKVVEVTSRGYFCKKDGVSGWYFGELEGTV